MTMTFIHVGYALMVFSLLLMLWISSTGAESFLQDCQPCAFNPMCSCTKSYDSLGEVHCVDVYFPRVPPAINRSRLSTLHLRNNDLGSIEPYFLVNTGKSFRISLRRSCSPEKTKHNFVSRDCSRVFKDHSNVAYNTHRIYSPRTVML